MRLECCFIASKQRQSVFFDLQSLFTCYFNPVMRNKADLQHYIGNRYV